MATAKMERAAARRGEDCLGKSHDNEPVFILRAQDVLAADLVALWACRASRGRVPEEAKINEAYDVARAMRAWHVKKRPD